MAKPEWGAKRICHNCGARFYDMLRDPIVCPKCSTQFDPEALLKSRRSRTAAVAELAAKTAVAVKAPAADADAVEAEDQVDAAASDDEAEEGVADLADADTDDEFDDDATEDEGVLLEDASELGDDDVGIDVGGEEDDSR